jgi:hypothetical protein
MEEIMHTPNDTLIIDRYIKEFVIPSVKSAMDKMEEALAPILEEFSPPEVEEYIDACTQVGLDAARARLNMLNWIDLAHLKELMDNPMFNKIHQISLEMTQNLSCKEATLTAAKKCSSSNTMAQALIEDIEG